MFYKSFIKIPKGFYKNIVRNTKLKFNIYTGGKIMKKLICLIVSAMFILSASGCSSYNTKTVPKRSAVKPRVNYGTRTGVTPGTTNYGTMQGLTTTRQGITKTTTPGALLTKPVKKAHKVAKKAVKKHVGKASSVKAKKHKKVAKKAVKKHVGKASSIKTKTVKTTKTTKKGATTTTTTTTTTTKK